LRRKREDLCAFQARTRSVKVRCILAPALIAALAVGCGGEKVQEDGGNAQAGPPRVPAKDVLSRDPYMGVSCRTPNSFACDRVGLAVWLRTPAARVDAAIGGRRLQLDDPEWSGRSRDGQRRTFAGFLQPAGLIDGPLHVTADDGPGRWIGRQPVSATVDLRIVRANGARSTTAVKVGLSPGWG
jgi:hypothetical protein